MNWSKKSMLFVILLLAITLIAQGIIHIEAFSDEWQIENNPDDCVRYQVTCGINHAYGPYWIHTSVTMGSGMRWTNITIPNGAVIQSAYVRWCAVLTKDQASSPLVTITGDDEDNCITFSTPGDYDGRPRTDASIQYQVPAVTINEWYNTNDLKTIIQEIIDRGGWESGNALALFTGPKAPSNLLTAGYSHDNDPAKSAKLIIVWSSPEIPSNLYGAGFNASSPYVELHWDWNYTYRDFFEVQNSSDGESWGYLGQSTTANYTDSQVVNGTERYYRVRACNQSNGDWYNSSWTDVNFETVYFIPDTEAPPPPPEINYPQVDTIEFNTTIAGNVCGVSGEFSDVEGLSGYIFWSNATSPPGGVNSSFTSLTGTSDSTLENITLPYYGNKLGVKYYVNDTDGNWAIDTLVIFPTSEVGGDFVCAPEFFNASSISVIVGTLNDGNLASTYFIDNDWFNVSEVVGPPGLDVRVNFTGVGVGCGCFEFYQTYTGHAHHAIDVQIWNFTSTSWKTIGPVFFNETANWACIGLGHNYTHFFDGGELWARFYLDGVGHGAHELHIDRIDLSVIQAEECPPAEEAPPVDDYSIIFLAIGLIFMLAIAFLYAKNK